MFHERYNAWSELLNCQKADEETLSAWFSRVDSYRQRLFKLLQKDAPSDVALTSSDALENDAAAIARGTAWVLNDQLMVLIIRNLPPKAEMLKWNLLLREDLDMPQLRMQLRIADEMERLDRLAAQRKAEEAEAKAKAAATPKVWCHVHEVATHATADCRAVKRYLADKERRKQSRQKASTNRT